MRLQKPIIEWQGGMVFQAETPTGAIFKMDSHPDFGGKGEGPTPMETLLCALAGCMAMDVLSILEKKRQNVTHYRIEVESERTPEGQYPRPFSTINMKHILRGDDLDLEAVARALQLSDEKYCSVLATLRSSPKIGIEWEVETELVHKP